MPKIIVRRLEREDLETRVAWFNDPYVYGQMTIDIPVSLAGTEEWFSQNRLNRSRADFCFFTQNEEGAMSRIAMCGLVDIDLHHRRAELYVVVNPQMTGRGIGKTAVQWLCNYGFSELNLLKIYLFTVHQNQRAQHLYERTGFVLEGILRQHVCHRGRFTDRCVYGILRDEWSEQQWRDECVVKLEVPM